MTTPVKALNTKLRAILNRELVRQLLKTYFESKGLENLDQLVYPPAISDLTARIPELADKVEIVPFPQELSPQSGVVRLGWNLFVLGTNRMFLGESSHRNMDELKRTVQGQIVQRGQTMSEYSPNDIIDFISETLSNSKQGQIELLPAGATTPGMLDEVPGLNRPKIGPTMSGGYYERNRPVN